MDNEAKDKQEVKESESVEAAKTTETGAGSKEDKVEGEISIDQGDDEKKSAWLDFVKKHQVIFLISAIVLFLLVVALVAVLFFKQDSEVDFSGGVKGNKWMGPVVSFSLNALLADDGDNDMKNLETEIFLELSDDDVIEEVVEKKSKLSDIFLGMLTEKQAREVDSLAEQTRLKQRIKELANAYLHTGKVEKVYFTRFRIVVNTYMVPGDAP